MPHRRQPPRHAGRFEAARVEIGEIVAQRLGLGIGEALAGAAEKLGEIGEVAAIGVERVVARALFRREHVEEQGDQFGVGRSWTRMPIRS